MQTEGSSCLLFIRSGQNHLARHSERGKKADRRRDGKTSGDGQALSSHVPGGSGDRKKMEETSCEVICGAPMTLAVRGQVKVK